MSSLSFIIPAYNEERFLGSTLAAINEVGRAVAEPFEVIVVDDASSDRTAEIARAHEARVIAVSFRQIARTRNAGAQRARGEWLIFVDADTLVTPAVVAAAIAALQAGAVGGGCALRFDGHVPRYGRVLAAVAGPLLRRLKVATGCFLFCTREAFQAVGGFDETLFAAEELAMSRALQRRGRFVILVESVTTSGRKLRAHSAREVLGALLRLLLPGSPAARRRDPLWYGVRRADPGSEET